MMGNNNRIPESGVCFGSGGASSICTTERKTTQKALMLDGCSQNEQFTVYSEINRMAGDDEMMVILVLCGVAAFLVYKNQQEKPATVQPPKTTAVVPSTPPAPSAPPSPPPPPKIETVGQHVQTSVGGVDIPVAQLLPCANGVGGECFNYPSCKPGCLTPAGNQLPGKMYQFPAGYCLKTVGDCNGCLDTYHSRSKDIKNASEWDQIYPGKTELNTFSESCNVAWETRTAVCRMQ
jgi:hypothetical protein